MTGYGSTPLTFCATISGFVPESPDIHVRDGSVTICGELERKSEVGLIADFVRGIDCVIDLDISDLTYRVDDRV